MAKQIKKGLYRVNAKTVVGLSVQMGLNVGDPLTLWTSLCEEHNESLGHETRNLALSHAATDAKAAWCTGCRDNAPAVGRSDSDLIEVIGVPKATANKIVKAIAAKLDEDDDAEPVRVRREISGESFKGKRSGSSYICPQDEAHGEMKKVAADVFRCEVPVSGLVTRVCSVWNSRDLNPKADHFVVEVLS